ncbi:MAG: MFS transporter [Promethearchaeota archaeon]
MANESKITLERGFFGLTFIMIGVVLFMLTNQPLMADVIDYDEIRTGKRRETTYSGINALLTKPAVSIGHALFLWIIDYFGYNEDLLVSEQPASVATGVLVAFTVIPIICLLFSALTLKFYGLDGPKWKEQKLELLRKHKEKEREFLEKIKNSQIIS